MKFKWLFLLVVFVLVLVSSQAKAVRIAYPGPYSAHIERVIDGDTVVATINVFPSLYAKLSIRIHGVDTPESSKRFSKCEKERLAGIKAKEFVKALFSSPKIKRVVITNLKWGKYAGRVLGDISFKLNGKAYSLKDLLISKGYAKPYFGKKKSDWCS